MTFRRSVDIDSIQNGFISGYYDENHIVYQGKVNGLHMEAGYYDEQDLPDKEIPISGMTLVSEAFNGSASKRAIVYTFEHDGYITGTARIYGWDARTPNDDNSPYQPTTDYNYATGSLQLFSKDGTLKDTIENGKFMQASPYYSGKQFSYSVSAGDYIEGYAVFAGQASNDWHFTSTSASASVSGTFVYMTK